MGGARLIAIDRLRPGRFQPRENFDSERMEQLAQSIRERGVLQPILVRPLSEADDFEIVAGERRWRAAQLALQHEVPVIVRELSDRDALEIALIENIQRQDLNPIEEGLAYRRLLEEFRYSQEELARHIGKSRPHIANTIRLLELPEAVRRMVIEGRLTAGHARPLIGQPNALELAAKIVKGGLSVRAAEALAKAASAPGRKTAKAQAGAKKKDADTRALEHDLTMRLGLKVEIDFDGKGGRLSIEYKTLDQLDDLIRKLSA
jgi:ParB family chromosome partitioning protein